MNVESAVSEALLHLPTRTAAAAAGDRCLLTWVDDDLGGDCLLREDWLSLLLDGADFMVI
jgi:hypothetical protein